MSDVMKKAEYLFDEIGLIDDVFVAEAMQQSHSKQRTLSLRRVTVAAVAAAMVFTASVGLTLSALIRKTDKNDGADKAPTQDGTVDGAALADSLLRAQSGGARIYAEAHSIDLFDGKTKLIWQRESSECYYVLDVASSADRQKLDSALDSTYSVSQNIASDDGVRLWISYGDGSVVSPYLRESAGNVGYGELFEYSPEIVPSDDLARLVDDLITP